jgi:protein-tyrosine phosphatase
MIDIHSHIIPSIDDGCNNINETLEIVKYAENCGIDKIFATSYYMEGKYENYRSDIIVRVDYINSFLKSLGVNVLIICGSEIIINLNTVPLLSEDKLCSLNNSRYVLIKFDADDSIQYVLKIVKDILNIGYIPIISNIEKYLFVKSSIENAYKCAEYGALLQLNILSLISDEEEIKNIAIKLLENNLIHFWGSNVTINNLVYKDKIKICIDELKKIITKEEFDKITVINPDAVYNDLDI